MNHLPYGPSLLILEISSISKGYEILNQLVSSTIKPLEAFSTLGGDLVGLLNGGAELEGVAKKLKQNKKIKNFYFLKNCPENLIKGFYSLLKTQTTESIFVMEFSSLSKLFQAAELGLEKQLEIVEIRSARSLLNKNLLILTGTKQSLSSFEKELKKKKIKTISSAVVSDLSSSFRESFGFL